MSISLRVKIANGNPGNWQPCPIPLPPTSLPPPPPKKQVLELGGGSAANLEFVISPTEWTITEPNVKFAPYFKTTVAKLRGEGCHAVVNDLVEACGEDLGRFAPASFDAVVTTFVLCTVQDPERVLSEVLRVLRPGGRLYFMEHVGGRDGTGKRQGEAGGR